MSKYSDEFKLEVVQYYLKNGGYGTTANKFGIPAFDTVRKWVKKYEEHGEKGLIKNIKTSYSGEFKQNVIEYMHDNHLSCQETSHHFNLGCVSVVSKWERIYYEEGPQTLYEEQRGRNKNMSSKPRKGNCLDNSLVENFFGLLKSELFYMKEYKTIEELEKDIIEYIDYYNNKRIKGKLKGMSPVQYRVHSQVA